MNHIKFLLIFLLISLLYLGCSSSEQGEIAIEEIKNKKENNNELSYENLKQIDLTNDETYVFDEPKPEKIFFVDNNSEIKSEVEYYIQILAYADLNQAKKATNKFKNKFHKELKIHFNEKAALYVVRLGPFESEEDADEELQKIKKNAEFKDAFVVKLPKQ
jgi:cell division protein FtsN